MILDSGFCVLEGIIELRKTGVYPGAVIIKKKILALNVPGNQIRLLFQSKMLGVTDALNGGIKPLSYDIFCMKEPDYPMKRMATYGELTVEDGQNESIRKCVSVVNKKKTISIRDTFFKPFRLPAHSG